MARITVEDCIDKFPSRFELVLVASQRARKLHSGDEPTVEKDNDKNTVIALREIADSTLTVAEMKENLIQEFQKVTLSDEEEEITELDTFDQKTREIKKIQSQFEETEIENEIKEFVSSEDSSIKEQYEINDGLNDGLEESAVSDEIEENTQALE
ncbi:uncharacterized protein METZ01_LOCUS285763 [marine metagenome]|uniref:DNA-directed RNA polymerase n=1 Tax=marine metagenome TaxID=408172 RepID=A0A382L8F0_9ZZZZ